MQELLKWLKNHSLKWKTLTTTILLILLVMMFILIFLYNDSNRALLDQGKIILQNEAEKSRVDADYKLNSVEDLGFRMIQDEQFGSFLSRYSAEENFSQNPNTDFQITMVAEIRGRIAENSSIGSVEVFLEHDHFIISKEHYIHKEKVEKVLPKYQWLKKQNQLCLIIPFNIFLEKNDKSGWLKVNIDPQTIFHITNDQPEGNRIRVLDNKDSLLYENMPDAAAPSKLPKSCSESIIDQNLIVCTEKLSNGWKVLNFVSTKQYELKFINVLRRLLPIMFAILLLGSLFTYLISLWLVNPIVKLSKHIKAQNRLELPQKASVYSNDEVGDLAKSYNQLVEDMDELFTKKQLEEKGRHEAEISAFQSQIQPHFLYNTLAIIRWSAKKRDTPQVLKLVTDLSRYYRLVLAKGKNFASLKDELDLVYYYLEIQKVRFSDQLEAEIVIDPEIESENYYVLHRILQPLVENSLEHGIFPQGKGKIYVKVNQDETYLYLSVIDDGIGASPEIVSEINQGSFEPREESGFSLVCIIQTLKSYYQDQVKVTFESIQGEGTIIEIRLKKRIIKR